MKRVILSVLILALALSMAACGQSEAAKAADEMIAAIGEVTLDSEQAIEKAEKAVSELEEKDRKQVKQVDSLTAARQTYEALVLESAVEEVESAISAIGTVTLESKDIIAAARKAYSDCGEDVQIHISNMDVLEKAEKQLETLQIEQVVQSIDAIGEVTTSSGQAIHEAQTLYNALSKESANKVENVQILVDANDTYVALLEKEIEAGLSKCRVEEDKIQGVKWYYSKVQPVYANTRSYVLPFIGMNNKNEVWLCAIFDYTGDNWVFFKSIIFSVDGKNTTKTYNYFRDIVRDNKYGDVWEYVLTPGGEEYRDLFWSIANSDETIVRFDGDRYCEDIVISREDKAAIKEILTIYEAMISAGYKVK